jgi:hypothetical protein
MIVRRIEPMSAAKVGGALYALLGLVFGALFTLISFTGFSAFTGMSSYGMLFGVGAIIILPIVYGICGFIFAGISAFFYNVAAKFAGGLEITTD